MVDEIINCVRVNVRVNASVGNGASFHGVINSDWQIVERGFRRFRRNT